MTQILGHNYIGGQRSAQGNTLLRSLDASTGEPLPGAFSQATEAEVDAAAKAAATAFPAYRNLPAEQRAVFLEAIADELDALGDAFIATVCRETALPAGRIQGERARTSGQMRLFATVLRRKNHPGAAPWRTGASGRWCGHVHPGSGRRAGPFPGKPWR